MSSLVPTAEIVMLYCLAKFYYLGLLFCGGKAGIQRKDGLDADVQPRDAKSLEHDFSGDLPVFGSVQRWLRQNEVVVLAVYSEVVSETLMPEPLHLVPICDLQL